MDIIKVWYSESLRQHEEIFYAVPIKDHLILQLKLCLFRCIFKACNPNLFKELPFKHRPVLWLS
jgi:hypothetical protein